MKGIRFKPDMIRMIQEHKKQTTFRKTRRTGEYEIVKGSWYKPVGLGKFVKCKPILVVSKIELLKYYYWLEGDFQTPGEFVAWLKENKLFDKLPEKGWLNSVEYLYEKDVEINKFFERGRGQRNNPGKK